MAWHDKPAFAQIVLGEVFIRFDYVRLPTLDGCLLSWQVAEVRPVRINNELEPICHIKLAEDSC